MSEKEPLNKAEMDKIRVSSGNAEENKKKAVEALKTRIACIEAGEEVIEAVDAEIEGFKVGERIPIFCGQLHISLGSMTHEEALEALESENFTIAYDAELLILAYCPTSRSAVTEIRVMTAKEWCAHIEHYIDCDPIECDDPRMQTFGVSYVHGGMNRVVLIRWKDLVKEDLPVPMPNGTVDVLNYYLKKHGLPELDLEEPLPEFE